MFGKQIHNFDVVLVVRLAGKPSFGRVRLNVTKENLAWTIGMPNRGFTSIGRARGPNLTINTERQGYEADGDVLPDAGFVGGKNGFARDECVRVRQSQFLAFEHKVHGQQNRWRQRVD
jgi:hypothetical protein